MTLMDSPGRHDGDLARIVLGVLTIGGLMAATFWILQPFLGAIIWAVMIVVATWSPMLRVQHWAGDRRWVAVAIMSVVQLLVLIVPLAAAVGTVALHMDTLIAWAQGLRDVHPAPPSWLARVPMAGERLVMLWDQVALQGNYTGAGKVVLSPGQLTGVEVIVALPGGDYDIATANDHVAAGHFHPEHVITRKVRFEDAHEAIGDPTIRVAFVRDGIE